MKVVLKNLTKQFPRIAKNSADDGLALSNFNLEIPDGTLVGLLGPSGCGKSTTLNIISGLLSPTEGQVYFGDTDVTNLSPEKRGIGLVFQNYALYPHLTVRENIMFPLENLKGDKKMSRTAMNEAATEIAKLVQIDGYLDRKPRELSGGQQQRVAIARALVKKPEVLLLDEPLSNLDARLRLQTREEIRRIQKETGITTVFVTHDQEEAMSISDIIVVMKKGVLNQVGKPQEIYDNPCNLFVAKFLGTPAINVFEGKIKDGQVYIGNEKVLNAPGVCDQDVYVAIRPEGFVLSGNGCFSVKLDRVEVMGRDISIVSTHEASQSAYIRSIVSSENADEVKNKELIRFDIKPNKIHIFNKDTEKRVF